MAKPTSTNIVEVWNWLVNVIESGELNLTEQIILVHVVAKFNRTMWTPTKLNKKMLAAAINKDTRTVTNALDKLVKMQILNENKGVYFIGHYENPALPDDDKGSIDGKSSSGKGKFQFKNDGNSGRDSKRIRKLAQVTDTDRKSDDGNDVSEKVRTARRSGKVFNENAI